MVGGGVHEGEDFGAGHGAVFEAASEGGDVHDGAGFFGAADGHAGVGGFEDAGDALGLEFVHECVGDLGGEAFLDLGSAGVAVDEAGEFGEADDFTVGEVGDVCAAGEGEEVVFAEGVELDVFEEDDFVVAFVEDGFEVGAGVFAEA